MEVLFDTYDFEWDKGNLLKLELVCKKRKMEFSEIMDVFFDDSKIISETYPDPKTKEKRFLCVGKSHQNRIISVIFVIRKNTIRPFNVWPTKGKKRNEYENQK